MSRDLIEPPMQLAGRNVEIEIVLDLIAPHAGLNNLNKLGKAAILEIDDG